MLSVSARHARTLFVVASTMLGLTVAALAVVAAGDLLGAFGTVEWFGRVVALLGLASAAPSVVAWTVAALTSRPEVRAVASAVSLAALSVAVLWWAA